MLSYLYASIPILLFYYRREVMDKYRQIRKMIDMLNSIDTESVSIYSELRRHGLIKYEYNGENRYILIKKDSEENALGQKLYVSIDGEVYNITPPLGVSFNSTAEQLNVDVITVEVDGISSDYIKDEKVIFPMPNVDLDL